MARVSILAQNRSDYINNGFTGENDAIGGFNVFAGRIQFLWTPTDNFTALLMHQQQDKSGNDASAFRANVLSQGSNELNANYDRNTVFFDGGNNNPTNLESHGTTIKLDWDISDSYRLTSITSYQKITELNGRGDIDGGFGCLFTCSGPSEPASTPFSPFNSPFVVSLDTGGDNRIKQLTQEIRLASNLDGPLDYQVGAFYFEDELDGISKNQNAGATVFVANSTSFIENTAWAIFGQGSYEVNEQLRVAVGVRYTDDKKNASHVDFSGVVQTVPINLSDDNISWDLAFSCDLTDDAQVYARFASGFRAPTIQNRIQDDVEVTTANSETIQSYEIGYTALWDRVRFSTTAFYYEIDDMQLVAVGGNSNITSLLNANKGIGYGVGFEMDYIVTDNLILSGGFGYNKTEIDDNTLSLPVGPFTTTTDPLDANGNALIDGNPFQHAPEWTLNVELDYTHPLSDGHEIYLYTDWKVKGPTNDFLYESIEFETDAQFEGGLRAGYRNTASHYEIG